MNLLTFFGRPWRTAALVAAAPLLLSACNAPPAAQVARPAPLVADAVLADLPGLPAATGFQTTEFDWLDDIRQRDVPALLYWPQTAAGQPVPLVVFSHGIGGTRYGYSHLARYWAGHGYASLHVQHVGSDRSVWTASTFQTVLKLREAAQETEALARVADLRFALDQLLAGKHGAQVDRQRMVVAGHSYGANTALLAAGAAVERDGQLLKLQDPRFAAAILLSAPPFYGEDDFQPILGGIRIPTLHVTATRDTIEIPGYYSPMSDRVRVFDAIGSRTKVLAVFEGGSHSVFTDRLNTGGENAPRMKTATQALSLAFLHRVFDGGGDALAAWSTQNQGLVSRFQVQ